MRTCSKERGVRFVVSLKGHEPGSYENGREGGGGARIRKGAMTGSQRMKGYCQVLQHLPEFIGRGFKVRISGQVYISR